MFKIVGFILLAASVSLGQPKLVSGVIIDDLGVPVDNVTVYNAANNSSVKSDCDGNYQIKALKKDTLQFSKDGYFESQKIVSKYKRNKIMLGFDYKLFVEKLEKNENMSKSISQGGQPLFIVDRKPFEKGDGHIKLKKEDIRVTKVVKGIKVQDFYGKIYSKNGVVLIFTNCDYKSKLGQ